jgi:hypothetical protein
VAPDFAERVRRVRPHAVTAQYLCMSTPSLAPESLFEATFDGRRHLRYPSPTDVGPRMVTVNSVSRGDITWSLRAGFRHFTNLSTPDKWFFDLVGVARDTQEPYCQYYLLGTPELVLSGTVQIVFTGGDNPYPRFNAHTCSDEAQCPYGEGSPYARFDPQALSELVNDPRVFVMLARLSVRCARSSPRTYRRLITQDVQDTAKEEDLYHLVMRVLHRSDAHTIHTALALVAAGTLSPTDVLDVARTLAQ